MNTKTKLSYQSTKWRSFLHPNNLCYIEYLPLTSQSWYGTSLTGKATFVSGFSPTSALLETDSKHCFVPTKIGNCTVSVGNGFSGTGTLFFDWDNLSDFISKLNELHYIVITAQDYDKLEETVNRYQYILKVTGLSQLSPNQFWGLFNKLDIEPITVENYKSKTAQPYSNFVQGD